MLAITIKPRRCKNSTTRRTAASTPPIREPKSRPPFGLVSDARSGDSFALLAESTGAPDAFHDTDGSAARQGDPDAPALRPTPPSQPSHQRSN